MLLYKHMGAHPENLLGGDMLKKFWWQKFQILDSLLKNLAFLIKQGSYRAPVGTAAVGEKFFKFVNLAHFVAF